MRACTCPLTVPRAQPALRERLYRAPAERAYLAPLEQHERAEEPDAEEGSVDELIGGDLEKSLGGRAALAHYAVQREEPRMRDGAVRRTKGTKSRDTRNIGAVCGRHPSDERVRSVACAVASLRTWMAPLVKISVTRPLL